MFIANDSNYTFGQFLANENGDDIKAPVYTKCFTDTEELKGYRFVHDPEETNPEKCVSFSIYDIGSETATATPFFKKAAVSDLTSVMFRLDAYILDDSPIRDKPFYHVIVPVENIADGTLKYLVIKMTKEVEIFPDDYPYYELADTFADAQPTSAEAPSGGGGGESDFSYATVTINAATYTESAFMISPLVEDTSDPFIEPYILISGENADYSILMGANGGKILFSKNPAGATGNAESQGEVEIDSETFYVYIITGNCTFTFSASPLPPIGE